MSDEEAIKIQEAGQESALSKFRSWIVLGLLYGVFFSGTRRSAGR